MKYKNIFLMIIFFLFAFSGCNHQNILSNNGKPVSTIESSNTPTFDPTNTVIPTPTGNFPVFEDTSTFFTSQGLPLQLPESGECIGSFYGLPMQGKLYFLIRALETLLPYHLGKRLLKFLPQ